MTRFHERRHGRTKKKLKKKRRITKEKKCRGGCQRGRATAPTGYSLRNRHMKGKRIRAFIALSLWASNASRKSTLALSLAKYLQVPIETININHKPLTGGIIPVSIRSAAEGCRCRRTSSLVSVYFQTPHLQRRTTVCHSVVSPFPLSVS